MTISIPLMVGGFRSVPIPPPLPSAPTSIYPLFFPCSLIHLSPTRLPFLCMMPPPSSLKSIPKLSSSICVVLPPVNVLYIVDVEYGLFLFLRLLASYCAPGKQPWSVTHSPLSPPFISRLIHLPQASLLFIPIYCMEVIASTP